MATTTTQRAFLTHQPRQLRRYIERTGGRDDPPTSARGRRSGALESTTQDGPVGGWMNGDDDRSSRSSPVSGARLVDSSRARQRFRSAVHVVQATHRWQRQTEDARIGQPWPDMPNIKPHLLVRSAKYKKMRRQLAAKERARKARVKSEQLRLRREEDEIMAAPDSRDAAVCAWLADLGLEQYYPKIRKFGAVDATELKAVSPAELDGIGMRKLEKARFLKAVEQISKESTEKIEVTVTCGTDIDGDVYEDGAVTHIRFIHSMSHLLLRQKACAALGMADRVGMRMEYLGPDDRWFALVDSDDMEDAVEFARHPGPPQALWRRSESVEPEPESEALQIASSPWTTSPEETHQHTEPQLAIRLVVPGELVAQQRSSASISKLHSASPVPDVDQGARTSPRGRQAESLQGRRQAAPPANVVVLEATVHGWHAEDFVDVQPPGSVAHTHE